MDLLKKRKIEDNLVDFADPDAMSAFGPSKLTIEDSRKILEPFTREQLLDIVQTALLRHADVLDAVRSIADRDPAQRKLFIRGIGWETTHDKLRSVFSQYGELEEAVVILDKATGKSKGYGFVTFKHVDGAIHALKEPSKKIDNRVTVTQYAAAGISGGPGGGSVNNPIDISQRKIYVANVPQDMPAERLLAHFAMYGEIEEGPLGFDKTTGKSKGFALFVYKTAEAARSSVVDPIKNIEGYQLSCKFAFNDGKKGKTGVGGPGGAQVGNEVRGDGVGVGIAGGIAGQYSGHGNMGGYSGYSGFPGGNPLNPAVGGGAGGGGLGAGSAGGGGFGAGGLGVGGMGPPAGNQAGGGSLGVGSGFGSGHGGGYGTGSQFGGIASGGYTGMGNAGAGSGSGLGVTGGGIGGTGSGLGVAGSGLGAAHGSAHPSSLYGLPPSSGGIGAGDYPQGAHYSLSSSAYQSQHQQPAGASPAPRVPSGGMYQGIRPYY